MILLISLKILEFCKKAFGILIPLNSRDSNQLKTNEECGILFKIVNI